MFLPNTDSFLLRRGTNVDPGSTVFLPNTDSFLLVRPVRSSRAAVLRTRAKSASATSNGVNVAGVTPQSVESTDGERSKIKDQGKRTFLKVAGIAGASLVASQLLPKKADAFIMGSSPTTGVVGVKDSANARINPATEGTVSSLLKPTDLTFDTGSLKVKVTGDDSSSFSDSGGVDKRGLVDVDRHVQVDVLSSALPTAASTEATLQTISTEATLETISFGGTKYALRLATVGDIDYVGEAAVGTATSAALWRIKKVDSTTGIIIQWADGNASFDNIWNNYASLSYS